MRTYVIFFILNLFSLLVYSQEVIKVTGLGTTFIVEGSVGREIDKGRCPCSVPVKGNCILYEMKISRILYFFDNKAFDTLGLISINKILIPKKVQLEKGKSYIFALQPGTSNKYIQYTEILNIDPDKEYRILHKDGYISSFIECEETNKFENRK
jgi:hypothetical protein